VDLARHEDKILLLLALVVSATVGVIIVAFVALTEHMGRVLLASGGMRRLLSPLIGSLVGGWLLYRFFPEARGSGIPQTRVALVLRDGVIGLRTVIGKFICASISLGSGVALGREGPSVHIGAGVASVAGRALGLSKEQVRSLIPVGTAAAVAAAFNTPLAAVLFTLEEILADLHARLVGLVVLGAATSWMVLRLLLGDEPLFHVPAYQLVHPVEFLFYGLLGIAGGLVSTAFVKLLLWQRMVCLRAPDRWRAYYPAVGGLTVGLLALVAPGVLGVGYNLVGDALNGQMALRMMVLLLALKMIATATSYSSGNAGGIFGPSLFIGAMLGGALGHVVHALLPAYTGNPGAYALVGMGAAFAGIVRTPMTSVIMIFEVTRDYTIIVPLMIANLCSYVLAQRLQRLPIYEALTRQEGTVMPSPAHRPEPLTVECAMRPCDPAAVISQPSVFPDDPLDTALQRLGASGNDEIAVLNRTGGAPIGVLGAQDALRAYQELERPDQRPARARNWLPAAAVITLAGVLIGAGLMVWQRARHVERGRDALRSGERLLAQGRTDEAVLALRAALAQTPRDAGAQVGLGLALVQSGHFEEASAYLEGALKSDPRNGPAWSGLARIASANGDKPRAAQLYGKALRYDWPAASEWLRRRCQVECASALAAAGRRAEAVALLLSVIEQRGDDPVLAKQAAAEVRAFGTPEQTEEACASLARIFPADATVWLSLGDARFAVDKDSLARDAYRRAIETDPGSAAARAALTRVDAVLRLDPTRRGLSIRERARRWDDILGRLIEAAQACGSSAEIESARPLLKRPATTLEASDLKMEKALRIWRSSAQPCRTDAVLAHILAKLGD
jgi:CIC family chloride channel protein